MHCDPCLLARRFPGDSRLAPPCGGRSLGAHRFLTRRLLQIGGPERSRPFLTAEPEEVSRDQKVDRTGPDGPSPPSWSAPDDFMLQVIGRCRADSNRLPMTRGAGEG